MKVQLRWTNQARKELKTLYKRVARDRPLAAEGLYHRIRERVLVLQEQPLLGERRSDLQPNVRVLVEHPYLIFYLAIPSAETGAVHSVEIVRVLHGSMDLPDRL